MIVRVPDEIPLRERPLSELKAEFHELEAAFAAFCRTLPTAAQIVAGEAALSDGEREQLERMQTRRTNLAEAIQNHVSFEGMTPVERMAALEAAEKQAKAEATA